MFKKAKKTQFGTTADFWSPIQIIASRTSNQVTMGLFASKADFLANAAPFETKEFFREGDPSTLPVDITRGGIRTQTKAFLKTLPDFQDATDED